MIASAVAVVALVLWVLLYYGADRPVEADVVDKRCSALGSGELVVKTRLFGMLHAEALDAASCLAVPVGAFVVYHLRSGHTIVYEHEGGRCIWDSLGPCVG
jgi:hypothetical protein